MHFLSKNMQAFCMNPEDDKVQSTGSSFFSRGGVARASMIRKQIQRKTKAATKAVFLLLPSILMETGLHRQ
jgi:hypothetical protein